MNIFDNRSDAVNFLRKNGTVFNKYTKRKLQPFLFIRYFGGKEAFDEFFDDFFKNCGYADEIKNKTKNEYMKKLKEYKI